MAEFRFEADASFSLRSAAAFAYDRGPVAEGWRPYRSWVALLLRAARGR